MSVYSVYDFTAIHTVHVLISVNLAGILGYAEAYPEGLDGGEEWGPQGEESGQEARPLPQNFFSLEMACFGEFLAVLF